MASVRRWYVYIVCAATLWSVVESVIELLRGLLTPDAGFVIGDASTIATAFGLAVIIVGLPIYLAHWLWAQRNARRDPAERESAARNLYLYGFLAAFLAAIAINGFYLLAAVLQLALGEAGRGLSPTQRIIQNLIALAVLVPLWFYHQRVIAEDARATPTSPASAVMRGLYVYGFSAAGLVVMTQACINLLRWLMRQFDASAYSAVAPTQELARLAVGAALWFVFWRQAQRLSQSADAGEHTPILRRLYLYGVLLTVVLAVVGSVTTVLAGLFRRILGVSSGGDIRDAIAVVIPMLALWAYHHHVLQAEAAEEESAQESGVRRIYLYLLAGIGLTALIVGVGGILSVLIRPVTGGSFGVGIKEQLAWFVAALIVGLPLWLIPWRQGQALAAAPPPVGSAERHAFTRRIYLFLFLGVAALTVLATLIFIIGTVLSPLLGATDIGELTGALTHAVAFAFLGILVWLYHFFVLRDDAVHNHLEWQERLAVWRVAVVDAGAGSLGRAVLEQLHRELPGLVLDPIGLTPAAAAAMSGGAENLAARLSAAHVVVGPWVMAAGPAVTGNGTADIAPLLAASPAQKILIPARAPSVEWAGVDHWEDHAMARDAAHAVHQIVAGETRRARRPNGCLIVAGVLFFVMFVLPFLAQLIFAALGLVDML